MLVPIEKSSLSDVDKISAVCIWGWIAIDVETGAYMGRSYGRCKGGLTKFYVILPHETPAERGGFLKPRQVPFARERSVIRAYDESDALEVANKRLPQLVKRVEKARARKDL